MKYCRQCACEYENNVNMCADCQSSDFVDTWPEERPPIQLKHWADNRVFVAVGTGEDLFTTERLTAALEMAHIPTLIQSHQWTSVDALSSAWPSSWWEISVPFELAERARTLITEERLRIDEDAEANALAAEEEALQAHPD